LDIKHIRNNKENCREISFAEKALPREEGCGHVARTTIDEPLATFCCGIVKLSTISPISLGNILLKREARLKLIQ